MMLRWLRGRRRLRRTPERTFCFLAITLALLVALAAVRAWAAYDYVIPISVTDTGGTARTNLVVLAGTNVNHTNLAAGGYIQSDALDTNLAEGATARNYTPRNTNLMFFLPTLGAFESKSLSYQLNYNPTQTAFPFMAGSGGSVATAYHADLEPGGSLIDLTWVGYFDATKTGKIFANGDIEADIGGAYGLYVSVAGTVRGRTIATLGGGNDCQVTAAVSSGVHTLQLLRSGATTELKVDTVSQGTCDNGGGLLDELAYGAYSLANGPVAYTTSLILDIAGGADELWYQPVTVVSDTTLPDRAGTAQNGVVTWGSQPGTLTVSTSAMLLMNEPSYVSGAQALPTVIGAGPFGAAGMYTATPNVGVYNLPFVGVIEDATQDVVDAEVIWLLILAVASLLGGIGLWRLTAVGGEGNALIALAWPAVLFSGAAISHLGNIGWWPFVLYTMAAVGFILLDPRAAIED